MSRLRLEIGSVPPTPPTGSLFIYPKADKKLYYKNDTGDEIELSTVAGPQGNDGSDGKTILSGTVDPSSPVGADGDFYINTATQVIFGPKVSGAWGSGTPLVNGIAQENFEYIETTAPTQPISGRVKTFFSSVLNRFVLQRSDNTLTPVIEINKETEKTQPLPDDEFVVWSDSDNAYRKILARNAIPSALQLRFVTFDEDDFITTTSSSKLNWTVTASGTSASAQAGTYGVNGIEKAFGVIQLDTGSTNAGRVTYHRSQNTLQLGYCKLDQIWRVAIEDLSNDTDTFITRIGFTDTNSAVEPLDGVYFRYTHNENSGNWQCYARSGNINETVVNTSVAANTNYNIFRIMINENATEALFYINDVLVATIAASIPSNRGDYTGIACQIQKTVGATQRNLSIDYFSQKAEFIGGR